MMHEESVVGIVTSTFSSSVEEKQFLEFVVIGEQWITLLAGRL